MLERFIEWLEDFVIDTGVYGLVKGVVGILAFGGILSVLLADVTIKAAFLIAMLLVTLGVFVLLTARLAALKRASEVDTRVSADLVNHIMDFSDQYWRILCWNQQNIVERNGDTRSTIKIDAIAELDKLMFFRMRFGSGWNQPDRHLRRVSASLDVMSTPLAEPLDVHITKLWRDDRRLEVLAYFSRPLIKGEQFRVRCEVNWPYKCQPMMRSRSADEFVIRPSRGLGVINYAVVLPRGMAVSYTAIGFDPTSNELSLTSHRSGDGTLEVGISGQDVQPTNRLGFCLRPLT